MEDTNIAGVDFDGDLHVLFALGDFRLDLPELPVAEIHAAFTQAALMRAGQNRHRAGFLARWPLQRKPDIQDIAAPRIERALLMPLVVEPTRSEEHTSELQSLMRISYDVFCLIKKNIHNKNY